MGAPVRGGKVGTWVKSRDRWTRWMGATWLVVLGLWMPVLITLQDHHAATATLIRVGVALGAPAVAATLVFGGGLGYLKQWRTAGIASLIGAGVLLCWFVWATISGPDPNNQNDHIAGAGVVILAIPTTLIVAVVIGLGAAVGRGVRALSRSR